jgi:flagellar biogenesis protein FliO
MPSYATYLAETVLTLLLVCGAAFVVLLGAKRLGIGRANGPVSLLGQLPLDARRSVYLIKIAEKVLVVGASEGGMVKLGELEAHELPVEAEVPTKNFAEIFAKLSPGKKS